jgi:FKBP-type peptidyl-prolyl cis-trans isomerase FkpA
MLKTRILLALFVVLSVFTSCKKELSPEKQAEKDESIIVDFIAKNNIIAKRDASGIYFSEIAAGTGAKPTIASTVVVKYEGRLLNGNVFDNGRGEQQSFQLYGLIRGWQIGIPLIKKGGKMRMIIPSGLAYGNQSPSAAIPKNAVLDFTIELIDIK